MSFQVLLFAVVIVSQCISPSLQLPKANVQPTVLEIFQKTFITKNCKTVLIDPNKADFLDQCNVPVPDLTKNLTKTNVISYLCMTYYDVNLKICDRLATNRDNFKNYLPTSQAGIQNITSHFDTVEVADEFCKQNHSNMGQSDYEETKQYVKVFAASISEPHLCTHACIAFDSKLNSFCKMIFWATLKLSDYDDATIKYKQMDDIMKQPSKPGLQPPVDQHIVPLAPKSPISFKQQETALPVDVANGGSDEFSLTNAKELEKNAYKTNVALSAPARTNTPIFGGGFPQRPKGPKVDTVPLQMSSEKVVTLEKEVTLEKDVTLEKEASLEKTVSPNKINPVEQESTPKKAYTPVKENPEKTTPEKTSTPEKAATAQKVPSPPLPKIEDGLNNSEDEDVERPSMLEDGAKSDDFGDEPEPDLPVKVEGEREREKEREKERERENERERERQKQREREGAESAVGAAGGAAPVENPTIEGGQGYTSEGEFVGSEDSHFFPYFLFASSILIVGYIIFHNKNKVLGLLLEGRRGEGRRRCPGGGPAYRKLDCTLEEAVSSAPPSHQPHIVY